MARVKSMASIETEITEAKEVVPKTKSRHEAAIAKDQLDAFKNSGKSYDTVMRYLNEGLRK